MTNSLCRTQVSALSLMTCYQGNVVAAGPAIAAASPREPRQLPAVVDLAAEPLLPADLVPQQVIDDMIAAGHGPALEPVVIPTARMGIDHPEGLAEWVTPTLDDVAAIAELDRRAFVLRLNAEVLVKDDAFGPLFESVRGEFIDGAFAYAGWVERHVPPVPPCPKPKHRRGETKLPRYVSGPFLKTLLGDDASVYLAALTAGPATGEARKKPSSSSPVVTGTGDGDEG